MADQAPNIILIQADQLKPQVLSCYGGSAVAPHLDALVERGSVFRNAYCNFPLCAPSRFSMLSGLWPSRIGAYDNGAEFPAGVPTMAHYLRLAGYHTVLCGKQHFVGPDMLHGFDERMTPELYPTDFSWTPSLDERRMDSNNDATGITKAGVCVRSVQLDHDEAVLYRARQALYDHVRMRANPLFLVASFTHPHEPYYALQRFWDMYDDEGVPMPATPLAPERERSPHTQRMLAHHALLDESITPERVRTARHAYFANVSYVDHQIGALLETLEETGQADNTVIVITADHGDMLGEHGLWFKKHFFDDCVRVPLIVVAPEHLHASHIEANVSLVDLVPTFADLAGLDLESVQAEPLSGTSLLSVAAEATADTRAVFSEITSEGVPSPMLMVKRGTFKLLTGGGVPDQIFDLASDPHERKDRVGDPALAATCRSLKEAAAAHWDVAWLEDDIRRSQRRRRIVNAAHDFGVAPDWDCLPGDPTRASLLRRPGDYNAWAWRGTPDE